MAVYAYRVENVYPNDNQDAADRVHSSAAAASVSVETCQIKLEYNNNIADLQIFGF